MTKAAIRFFSHFFGGVIVWQVISYFLVKDRHLFPGLDDIAARFSILIFDPDFRHHLVMSGYRLLTAATVAIPLAIAAAFVFFWFGRAGAFFNSLFIFTYPLPKVAILPFALLAFGIGDSAKIFIIGLGIFYLVYFNTQQGIRYLLNHELHQIVTVYRISPFYQIWYFYFKGCLPFIFSGLRVGFGYGLSLIVVSEISMSTNGLGFFLWSAWDQFRVVDMYVGLFCLALLGFGFNALFGRLEKMTWLADDQPTKLE